MVRELAFDVVVAGGGIAGSVCATALAQRGARVLLLERSSFTASRIGEIIHESVIPLIASGLRIEPVSLQPFAAGGAKLHVRWGKESDPASRNSTRKFLRIHRVELDRFLFRNAAMCGVTTWLNASARRAARDDQGWTFEVQAGRSVHQVRASLAVEATGRTSYAIFSQRGRITADRAVACALRFPAAVEGVDDETVCLESGQHGWWYTSRIPTAERLLVFVTDRDVLPGDAGARAQWLSRQLSATQSIKDVCAADWPAVVAPQPWRRHDARMGIRVHCSGERWLAIGDAQMSLDPLSGMGVLESIRSALEAVPFVQDAMARGQFDHARFAQTVAARYNRELLQRASNYERERRWPAAPFWSRRQVLSRTAAITAN